MSFWDFFLENVKDTAHDKRMWLVDFKNIIDEYLIFLVINDTSFYKNNIIKFIVFLALLSLFSIKRYKFGSIVILLRQYHLLSFVIKKKKKTLW